MKIFTQEHNKKFHNTINLVFVLGIFLLSFISPANAFDDRNFSEREKVGLAFYKLGNIAPDFESWIRSSSTYKNLVRPRERGEFLESEKHRLEEGLRSYYPEFGQIKIKTSVTLKGMPPEELKRSEDRYIKVKMNNNTAEFYFPYPVGNEWVALIPRNIEKMSRVNVTQEQYDLALGKNFKNTQGGKEKAGVMELILQPVSVDTSKPLELEGIHTWLMDGDVASMAVWADNKRILIWEYTAPWYVSDTQRGIHGLYGK